LNETLLTKLADSPGYPPGPRRAGTEVPDLGRHREPAGSYPYQLKLDARAGNPAVVGQC